MTFPITRVLVPMDFSVHSAAALDYGVALAAQLGAALEVLHVVDDPFGSGAWGADGAAPRPAHIEELYANLVSEAERELAKFRSVTEKSRVPATFVVRMGQPAPLIVEYATSTRADLIVMGTHGRTGVKHAFMGSVAERVMRHAPCPVVTLRGAADM